MLRSLEGMFQVNQQLGAICRQQTDDIKRIFDICEEDVNWLKLSLQLGRVKEIVSKYKDFKLHQAKPNDPTPASQPQSAEHPAPKIA